MHLKYKRIGMCRDWEVVGTVVLFVLGKRTSQTDGDVYCEINHFDLIRMCAQPSRSIERRKINLNQLWSNF